MRLVVSEKSFVVFNIDNSEKFECSKKDDAVRKLEDMGVSYFEIEDAFVDMNSKRNNVAHFGINGTFIFSEKQERN